MTLLWSTSPEDFSWNLSNMPILFNRSWNPPGKLRNLTRAATTIYPGSVKNSWRVWREIINATQSCDPSSRSSAAHILQRTHNHLQNGSVLNVHMTAQYSNWLMKPKCWGAGITLNLCAFVTSGLGLSTHLCVNYGKTGIRWRACNIFFSSNRDHVLEDTVCGRLFSAEEEHNGK